MNLKNPLLLCFISVTLLTMACNKSDDCPACGFYNGLSQKADFIPGTKTGIYTTTTQTYHLTKRKATYTIEDYRFIPDIEGNYVHIADSTERLILGYDTLTVALKDGMIRFDVRKPEGLYEVFEGKRIH